MEELRREEFAYVKNAELYKEKNEICFKEHQKLSSIHEALKIDHEESLKKHAETLKAHDAAMCEVKRDAAKTIKAATHWHLVEKEVMQSDWGKERDVLYTQSEQEKQMKLMETTCWATE